MATNEIAQWAAMIAVESGHDVSPSTAARWLRGERVSGGSRFTCEYYARQVAEREGTGTPAWLIELLPKTAGVAS